MKRLGVQLLSLLLAGMFLVSFAGIRLLSHHCFLCESTDVVMIGFAQDDHFDGIHHDHHEGNDGHQREHSEEQTPCCENDEKGQGCHCGEDCESEIHYLRAEYDASADPSPAKIATPEFELLPARVASVQEQEGLPLCLSFVSLTDPPPKPAGRELVILSCRLKYC
ncbi:MAG: hypothetical protein ACLFN2_03720 [Bacteroidales bacterium]